jgi:hypothetical protein
MSIKFNVSVPKADLPSPQKAVLSRAMSFLYANDIDAEVVFLDDTNEEEVDATYPMLLATQRSCQNTLKTPVIPK